MAYLSQIKLSDTTYDISAIKLKNARTIQINLASTSSASFDGTVNISPGVAGILPVANGGTGASDHVANRLVWSADANKIRASYHYANASKVGINSTSEPSTNFYVDGTSAFNGDVSLNIDNNDRYLTFNYTGGTGYNWRIGYLGSGAGEANYLVFQSNKEDGASYQNALRFGLTSLDAAFGGNVYPLTDNTKTLGTSTNKWNNVYATTFTGNATSATRLATAVTLKIGKTGKSFDGSSGLTWTDNEVGYFDLVDRGSQLADGTNLNDVGYGNFYANASDNSTTMINPPLTSAGFRLISQRGYNSSNTNYHWQYATTSSRTIYQRYKGSGDWSEWGTIVLNPTKNQLGSATQPVYIGSSGTAIACTAYSGLLTAFTSSTNTLSITVGGTTKTANAVNSVSNTWTGGTTAGPTLKTTVNGVGGTAVAIPSASASASGIVTTGAQRFRGSKTLEYPKISSNNTRYQGYHYVNGAGTILGEHWYDTGDATNFASGRYYWRQWSPNSTANTSTSGYHETYSLPAATAGLTENKTYEIFTSKSYSTLDSRYVNVSGDTMTGVLTFKNTTATPAKGTILNCIQGQYQNAAGNYYTLGLVDLVASAEEGTTVSTGFARFGSHNGASFFTAGESGRTMPKALANASALTAEAAYITADSSIIMYAGCANDATSYTKAMTVAAAKVTSHVPLYGAVWNDYAEYRICKEKFEPGRVVYENGDDTMSISNNRLQRGCSIISDTFGFAIGETDEAKCPVAVSGRVLAYGYESREEFKKHIGWPVCSGPNGTVSIMTEEEEEKYPSRIVGTISAVPDYETWGTGNVEVNDRIWIKIK